MKAASGAGWIRAGCALTLWAVLAFCALAATSTALALDNGSLNASEDGGYGRIVLSFPDRTQLPVYTVSTENGVLSILFQQPVTLLLPDVGAALPDYISGARLDADGRGLRLGLRQPFTLNSTEAGERLFLDLLPTTWSGKPPSLPQDVLDLLAARARKAAIAAEQQRKADQVAKLKPEVNVRIGRNPTFMRLQFDWSIDTQSDFAMVDRSAVLAFEWPVAVDMTALKTDLPAEIKAVDTSVDKDGSLVELKFSPGVKPRFYKETPRTMTLDIDLAHVKLPDLTVSELDAKAQAEQDLKTAANAAAARAQPQPGVGTLYPDKTAATITPYVSTLGSTVRVVFPFEQDTPAAVFRRGNTVWMLFDTTAGITAPKDDTGLKPIASAFSVMASGDTQAVRLDLSQDRLATLGSEGRAWVLSLGDVLLTPTEPMALSRRRDGDGQFQMTVDLERPARVHEFADPTVGDTLEVVTAYPPARGILRNLNYVDFDALRSVHGLVIRPAHDGVEVAIDGKMAVISSPGGLTVSAADQPRGVGTSADGVNRAGFVDLGRLQQNDPDLMTRQQNALKNSAANTEGRARDTARLDLAQHLLANGYAYEALGVLKVMEENHASDDLSRKLRLTGAIANTVVNRDKEALAILNGPSFSDEADALVWRAIARADSNDFNGAKQDALASEPVIDAYPGWVRSRYRFAAIRAAVETGDVTVAERMLAKLGFADLDVEQASLYHLLSGRIEELKGQTAQAMDTYGQVITADIRPTRAEAIYRTMLLLDQQGNIDLDKAIATLSSEAMLWRGGPLEASMDKMLAEFYFRNGSYRQGFETVKQTVAYYPESQPLNALRDEAQQQFIALYLNGQADRLGPVEALSLFYDFQQLTPPGARGDEMIRNLARRLVKVDLLSQAAELLDYQLKNRLQGAAQAQVAADLAVIYLADHRPQDALRVLNATRLPNLPPSLLRQRRMLEARALLDGGREELALDLIKDMQGHDVDQMRIDANWRARRYGDAGRLLETRYADAGPNTPLSQPARMNIIKAAVGYVLANDQLSLARLRGKFSDAMVTAPEWPMFDYVTGTIAVESLEFKKVAAAVSGIDSLNGFLAAYRAAYGEGGALAPVQASKGEQKVAAN